MPVADPIFHLFQRGDYRFGHKTIIGPRPLGGGAGCAPPCSASVSVEAGLRMGLTSINQDVLTLSWY